MSRTWARWLVPVAAMAMLVGAASPGMAVQPVHEVYMNVGIFSLDGFQCDGYALTEETVSERVDVTTYFDRSGDPVKEATHANFFGVITNPETLNTYRDHATFTETVNVDGTTTVSGVSYHYITTGHGQVFAEVGHKITVDADGSVTFQAGQDDYVQLSDAGLCAALV